MASSNNSGNQSGSLLPVTITPPPKLAPLFHVMLHNDDTHTYNYVIRMLIELFGKSSQRAYEHAHEVDTQGVTIVDTAHLERAELKRDQIRAYGKDPELGNSTGSMSATIEKAR